MRRPASRSCSTRTLRFTLLPGRPTIHALPAPSRSRMYRLHWCREHKTLQEEVAYANHLDRQMSSPQALSFARRESMKAYSQDLRKRVLRAVDLGRERHRGCAAVWRLAGYHQAIPETTTRGRAYAAQSDSWSSSQETGPGGGRRAAPITRARCCQRVRTTVPC